MIHGLIIVSVIATGISSVGAQLLTVREFVSQFHGNEITISLVLFCWLLFTGLGSLCGRLIRRSSLPLYAVLLLIISVWPLLQIITIRLFREALFIHGVSPGFYSILMYITVTTVAYSVLVGFVLPYALTVLKDNHCPCTSGELYLFDNIGDIGGGILFSFILVHYVKPFETVAVTSALLIIISFLILFSSRRYFLCAFVVLSTSAFYFVSTNDHVEKMTLLRQYGEIVKYVESPYGRIVITKEQGQHTFWESGLPLYSDASIISSEEKIHYPLCQLEKIENVLLISGGLGEALVEISKYRPQRIDYVELDPQMTAAAQELGFIKEVPALHIRNTDGRKFVKETTSKYDVVIIDLPDPDTFQINRFFTSEFFALTKRVLAPGGILSFGLEYSPNYLSDVRKRKLSSLHNTAGIHFHNVLLIPGEKAYFLCSDGMLSYDIPARLEKKGIDTDYIEGYFKGNVTEERIQLLRQGLDPQAPINTDFEPKAVHIVFQEWFMEYGTSPKPFILALSGLVLLYLLFLKKEEYILFSTGLTTMGVEMLVIFAFQTIYGYIYLQIGAIITTFLAGLLPGAIVGNYYKKTSTYNLIFSEMSLTFLLIIFFLWVRFIRGEPYQFSFLFYCFVFSFFCGFQFPAAAQMIGEERSPAAGCFAADLTGAAVGTLVTGVFLIPIWGIESAIIFLILMKISSNIVMLFSKMKRV